jgi:hypothetical protein
MGKAARASSYFFRDVEETMAWRLLNAISVSFVAGLAVFTLLSCLNVLWFSKLLGMALRRFKPPYSQRIMKSLGQSGKEVLHPRGKMALLEDVSAADALHTFSIRAARLPRPHSQQLCPHSGPKKVT